MEKSEEKQFKILAVDDNTKNIQVLGSILREAGYSVGFALDGQQALTLLEKSYDYDLVLLDVNMPVLNGIDTCIAMRKNKRLKDIPVIFLTALNDPSDIFTGFKAGGQDYVTKPFNSRELLLRVKTHLDLKHTKDKLAESNLYLEKRVLERTEELNKAKLKAEESERLKSAFLSLINHEIRTPLSSIVGFSSIIAESNENPELMEFSKIVYDQNELMMQLIGNIIDSAEVDSGILEIHSKDFDLNELITELYNALKSKCKPEVVFNFNTPLEEISIHADRLRIKQIYSNVILNAIQFTSTGTITFGYKIKGSELIGFVKDTGVGIPIDNQHTVFERFTKLDSFSQGAGLGLSIAKDLINLMNGEIWIEPESNIGTVFNFKVPIKIVKTTQPKIIPKKGTTNGTKKVTILVAEDEEFNYLYLYELLTKQNMNIIHALNGKEALELCINNEDIDMVLMDINMPILNGLEATKQIKEIKPQLPIIAQTAYTLSEDIIKTEKAGCDGHISKPINKDELFAWIKKFS